MSADVTVVVPTRNRSAMLRRTLGCILGQEGASFEVVVVDEGSTDDTPEYLATLGPAVRVVRHDEPRGLPAARNAGLAAAGTPWVAFCDDDDLWAPTKLAAQLAAVTDSGWRWSVVGVVLIDVEEGVIGHSRALGGDLAERLRLGNVIPGGGSAVLADTALVRELGGFDEGLRACEDYDLWVRLGQRSPLAAVDRPLAAYRVWPRTMSTDTYRQRAARQQVVDRYRGDLPDELTGPVDLRYRQYLARAHLRAGARIAGFRDYLDIARRHRDRSQAAHAIGALLVPGLTERWRARQELAEVPADWKAEGEAWLRATRPTRVAA